jgi:hypothetical protein
MPNLQNRVFSREFFAGTTVIGRHVVPRMLNQNFLFGLDYYHPILTGKKQGFCILDLFPITSFQEFLEQ